VELARLYRLASTGQRDDTLRSSQAKWRDERNACATAVDVAACAVRSYVERYDGPADDGTGRSGRRA
jgi:uncharacterized protein